MTKTAMIAATVISSFLTGCGSHGSQEPEGASCEKVRYLCVGMEYSGRFGSCPGCEKDAKRISALMKERFGYSGDVLISGQATKDAVVEKLKEGLDSTPEDGMFMFFYSGHGGQEYLGGKEPEGSDAQDEYLCLFDSHMTDDEIWLMVNRCRGRVFLYFDACHSATMWRSVSIDLKPDLGVARPLSADAGSMVKSSGFGFYKFTRPMARAMSGSARSPAGILCWSGCKESEYSYGGSGGGTLTTAVVTKWKPKCSYASLWENVRSYVVRVQPGQNPVCTYIGHGFKDSMEAFR